MPKQKVRRLGEALLVLAIIGILTIVWLQGTEQYTQQTHQAQAKQQIYTLAQALRAYQINHGDYPSTVNNLPFCEPFKMYRGQLCLYQLIGDYVELENIKFSQVQYIYAPTRDDIILAADIPASADTPMTNRCTIGSVVFWCLTISR